MKLSELYTELKLEGFGQYIQQLEQARAANQSVERSAVQGSIRAGQAVSQSIEALRRVRAGGSGLDLEALRKEAVELGKLSPGARLSSEFRVLGTEAERARGRMISLTAAGQPMVWLLASALPDGAGRSITAIASLGNIATIASGKMRALAIASRAVPYALAAATGYALGSWGAKKIFESQTGMSWEETSDEALAADRKNAKGLLENANQRQVQRDFQAMAHIRDIGLETLRIEAESLEVHSEKRKEIEREILMIERERDAASTGNLEERAAIRGLYDIKIANIEKVAEKERQAASVRQSLELENIAIPFVLGERFRDPAARLGDAAGLMRSIRSEIEAAQPASVRFALALDQARGAMDDLAYNSGVSEMRTELEKYASQVMQIREQAERQLNVERASNIEEQARNALKSEIERTGAVEQRIELLRIESEEMRKQAKSAEEYAAIGELFNVRAGILRRNAQKSQPEATRRVEFGTGEDIWRRIQTGAFEMAEKDRIARESLIALQKNNEQNEKMIETLKETGRLR